VTSTCLDVVNLPIRMLDGLRPAVEEWPVEDDEAPPIREVQHQPLGR
jgi:hypothetical protein